MSWFTRRRSSKPFPMNLTRLSLKCQDIKKQQQIQIILSFSNFYFFLSSCFLFQQIFTYLCFDPNSSPFSPLFSHGSFFTGDFMLKSNFDKFSPTLQFDQYIADQIKNVSFFVATFKFFSFAKSFFICR